MLAYHLSHSGAAAEAIPYWESAGLRAALRGSHVEASGHFRSALECLSALPENDQYAKQELILRVRLALSLSSWLGYATQEVRTELARAHVLCDVLGNVAEVYHVLRGLCTFYIVGNDLRAAESFARRCRDIGERTARPEYLIESFTPLGYIFVYRGQYKEGLSYLERAPAR